MTETKMTEMKRVDTLLSVSEDCNRLEYNDIAKSIGMLLIVWGHIRLNDWSNAFVYAFHIPLFFMLSGMVFNKSRYPNFKILLNKKIKSLLIPYMIFSFLTWIVWAGFSYIKHTSVESYWMPLAETFIAQGSGGYLVHNVPLWFVTCLFVMEMMYYFLAKLKWGWIMVITILMAAVSYFLVNYFDLFDITTAPWNVEVAMLGIPFYTVGHWAVTKWGHQGMIDWVNKNKIASWLIIVAFTAIVVVGSSYNGSISFGHANLGKNVFVAYTCAFLGVALLLMLCMLITETSFNKKNGKLIQSFKWFGRNSFYAMVIHNPIKGGVAVLVGSFFHCGSAGVSNDSGYAFVAFILTLIITLIGILFINWFKNKYLVKR